MKNLIIVVAMLCGCSYGDNDRTPTGKYVQEMCGLEPATPGWTVAFEKDRAIMWTYDYTAMSKALREFSDWSFCVSHLE